jgi:hypothetical protein
VTSDFEIAEGDEIPRFVYAAVDTSGDVIDLTGYTILFRMRLEDDPDAVAIEANGALDDATAGVMSAPVAGPAGMYHAEFVATSGGNDRSFPPDRPLRVHIRPRV